MVAVVDMEAEVVVTVVVDTEAVDMADVLVAPVHTVEEAVIEAVTVAAAVVVVVVVVTEGTFKK